MRIKELDQPSGPVFFRTRSGGPDVHQLTLVLEHEIL